MESRTIYAVLGMLQDGPSSGYDLKKEFEDKVRHFWAESVGQIYPALKKASGLGWVSARVGDRSGRRRTEYALTKKGRAALEEWFQRTPAPPPVRHELLLKTFLGAHLDMAALARHVDDFAAHLREERRRLSSYDDEIDEQARSPEQAALWRLTLSAGKHVNRARLSWCREARKVLAQITP